MYNFKISKEQAREIAFDIFDCLIGEIKENKEKENEKKNNVVDLDRIAA
jgi:hypothetical protein